LSAVSCEDDCSGGSTANDYGICECKSPKVWDAILKAPACVDACSKNSTANADNKCACDNGYTKKDNACAKDDGGSGAKDDDDDGKKSASISIVRFTIALLLTTMAIVL